MLEINHFEDKHLMGFTLRGELDEQGIDDFMRELEIKAKDGQVHLLGEIDRMGGFHDMKTFFSVFHMKLKAIKNVDKYAVVTDIGWLEKLVPIGDFLMKNIDVRLFHLSDKDEALEWLRGDIEEPFQPGIGQIEMPEHPHILGYLIKGDIHVDDYKQLNKDFEEQKNKYGEIKVYLEFLSVEGYEPKAAWEDFKMGLHFWGDVKKIAMLSSKKGIGYATKLRNILSPGMEIKFFEVDQKRKAILWLEGSFL